MKLILPLIGLAFLAMVGCSSKPATQSSTLDLSPPPASARASYTPMAAPPMQTAMPETNPMPINAVASSGSTYTIKPGDTLWKISASHYGDGKKWKQIADANPGLNPNKLTVGKTITLP